MKQRLDRAADSAGVALDKACRNDLCHRVVPGFVVACHHRQRTVPVALERIAGFGREDVDPASVQDLQDVFSKRPEQPPILSVGLESADLTVELIVQSDQIRYYGLQHHAADPAAELLVLLVQPVDDRFPMRRTPVKLAELLLNVLKTPDQLGDCRAVAVPFPRLDVFGPAGIEYLAPVQSAGWRRWISSFSVKVGRFLGQGTPPECYGDVTKSIPRWAQAHQPPGCP